MYNHQPTEQLIPRDTVVMMKKSETADLMDYTDSGIPGIIENDEESKLVEEKVVSKN